MARPKLNPVHSPSAVFAGVDLDDAVKSVVRFLRGLPYPMGLDAAPLAEALERANRLHNIAARPDMDGRDEEG